MAWPSDLSPRWLGKQEMFAGPLRFLFRARGGVPVDRENPGSLEVDISAHAGATDTGIPIVLCYLDGPKRAGRFGPVIHPTGEVKAYMDLTRAFYVDKGGVKPENRTTPRRRDEESPTLLRRRARR